MTNIFMRICFKSAFTYAFCLYSDSNPSQNILSKKSWSFENKLFLKNTRKILPATNLLPAKSAF